MIWVDCQVIMLCVPKVEGVENEESMWKHSPKIYSRLPSKTTSSSHLCLLTQLFSKHFSIKVLLLKIKLVPLHRVLF